ncbi:MAG: YeeE/YedE family protein [Proteobacteria bacterium]|nr:YeeE/YedE family protein [Pseudomonadota bacterium]
MHRWSPYAVGAGIGVLSWISFLISDKPLGASTSFARTTGMILKVFHAEKVERNRFFREVEPQVDWQWMLVLGIVIGAAIAALISGDYGITWVPQRWALKFGAAPAVRLFWALVGGTIMGIGARWAGGCTSGHGISGFFQLAVSSWIAVLCFFVSGTITALILL